MAPLTPRDHHHILSDTHRTITTVASVGIFVDSQEIIASLHFMGPLSTPICARSLMNLTISYEMQSLPPSLTKRLERTACGDQADRMIWSVAGTCSCVSSSG